MAAIETSGLTKHFGDVHAVNGVDLSVEVGEIYGFLGANGSGKTTMVRMLTTLLQPTSGWARVDGLDVVAASRQVRARIGVALQDAGLDDLQTGRELLRLQARLYRVPSGTIEGRISDLLDVVEMQDDADRPIGTYSGGMRRRLDLAAALVHGPPIVFLDEPTTGLDPISRNNLWRYLEMLNRQDGVTIFLTTQYLEEADRLADRVAILDRGTIVSEGSPAALKKSIAADVVTVDIVGGEAAVGRARPVLQSLDGLMDLQLDGSQFSLYLGDGGAAISSVVRLLDEESIAFGDVTLSQPTLDDVFLRKTGRHIIQSGDTSPDGEGSE